MNVNAQTERTVTFFFLFHFFSLVEYVLQEKVVSGARENRIRQQPPHVVVLFFWRTHVLLVLVEAEKRVAKNRHAVLYIRDENLQVLE